jgi:predicted RNA binding protein YcfA (HicA-like mRNA interferase family)
MSKLPRISGRECARALERVAFLIKRQESTHMILRREDPFAQVVIPDHRELDRGTLRAIIRHAGLSVNQFIQLLKWAARLLFPGPDVCGKLEVLGARVPPHENRRVAVART